VQRTIIKTKNHTGFIAISLYKNATEFWKSPLWAHLTSKDLIIIYRFYGTNLYLLIALSYSQYLELLKYFYTKVISKFGHKCTMIVIMVLPLMVLPLNYLLILILFDLYVCKLSYQRITSTHITYKSKSIVPQVLIAIYDSSHIGLSVSINHRLLNQLFD